MNRKIFFFSLSLMFIFIFSRIYIFDLWRYFPGFKFVRQIMLFSHYDFLFTLSFGLIFLVTWNMTKAFYKINKVVEYLFYFFMAIFSIWAILNIHAVKVLNGPLNYQMIYFADLMDSKYLLDSLRSSERVIIISLCFLVVLSVFTLGYLMVWLSKVSTNKSLNRISAVSFSLCWIMVIFYFNTEVRLMHDDNYDQIMKAKNPMSHFGSTFISSFNEGGFLFQNISFDLLDDQIENALFVENSTAPKSAAVNNVIILVLESVQADYISGYNQKFMVTPNIEKHLSNSVIFSDVYAHSPNSTNSLFSILGSIYPLLSYKNIIKEKPQFEWPTLSSELKSQGYKTSFFHSSDNSYQRVNEFLSYRKFDRVSDYRDMGRGSSTLVSLEEGVTSYVKESKMIKSFLEWLPNNNDPFFSVLWTVQTHYPYFTYSPEIDYGVGDKSLNRYLNSLRETDEVIGLLLEELQALELLESTLIVLVGDHGEAFGLHGQYGHGSNLYDENVKVPLIFINPVLFTGEKKSVIGGHIDIAVSIFDILDLQVPKEWQGVSLFNPHRDKKTFFFSTWSDYLVGVRNENHKVIYNAYTNKSKVFDLSEDPDEFNDLSKEDPDFLRENLSHIGRFVQGNRLFYKGTF